MPYDPELWMKHTLSMAMLTMTPCLMLTPTDRPGRHLLLHHADQLLQHVAPPLVHHHRGRQVAQQVLRIGLQRVQVPARRAPMPRLSRRGCMPPDPMHLSYFHYALTSLPLPSESNPGLDASNGVVTHEASQGGHWPLLTGPHRVHACVPGYTHYTQHAHAGPDMQGSRVYNPGKLHAACAHAAAHLSWKNRSMMALRPLSWLKNTNSAQCISQVRCCSCCSSGANVLASMMSLRRVRSSSAASQFCISTSAASLPHSALSTRSLFVASVLRQGSRD